MAQQIQREEEQSPPQISPSKIIAAAIPLIGGGALDVAMHGGLFGAALAVSATIIAARHSDDLLHIARSFVPGSSPEVTSSSTRQVLSAVLAEEPVYTDQRPAAKLKRFIGMNTPQVAHPKGVVQEEAAQDTVEEEEGTLFEAGMEEEEKVEVLTWETSTSQEDILLAPKKQMYSHFSQVLSTFTPSLGTIFLATLPDGTLIFVPAKSLCHVALAGSTGQGKSTLIRLLMAQLCKAGASVLLLNPHYTRYDLEADEDWTPFEPYLVYDPMECRKYEVIEFYLKQVAEGLLPKRLEKYAHSRPVGKPYFLVIDELPAIMRKVPNASTYLETILREGRKVGIFLITAAQDFLVKTIAPQGGGAVRDCFRTAMYVGGDPTTARVLLDIPARNVPEDALGKGTIMLRCQQVKQAALALVPYVDNQALYRLLGPSTYVPTYPTDEDDALERLVPRRIREEIPSAEPPVRPLPMREQVASYTSARACPHPTKRLPPELQRALDTYKPGMSFRQLADALGDVNKDTAGKYIKQLRERRLIS